jgi:hypothetical protein
VRTDFNYSCPLALGPSRKCRSGRSNRSEHGGRLPRLQSIENRSRQPVLWVPPTAPESAIKLTRSGAEQRARTTAAGCRRAAPNGTSRRAHQPANAYIESDVRTSETIIQSRRFVFQELVGSPIFGVYDLYSRTTVNGTSAIPRVSRNHSRNRRPHEPVVGRLGGEFRFLSLALHREGSAPYLLQPSSRYWPRADGSRREDPCSSSPRS